MVPIAILFVMQIQHAQPVECAIVPLGSAYATMGLRDPTATTAKLTSMDLYVIHFVTPKQRAAVMEFAISQMERARVLVTLVVPPATTVSTISMESCVISIAWQI